MRKWITSILIGLGLVGVNVGAASAADTFRLCTGNSALNYYKAGHILKARADGSKVAVNVVETKGSMDNLDKIVGGECDGGYVQADALMVYSQRNAKAISSLERAGVLYKEYVHLLCNRNAGIKRIVDLSKTNTISIGSEGAGNATTWEGFKIADKKRYTPVMTDSRSGQRALSAVADGSQVQCLITVASLNSSFVKGDAQQQADRLQLIPADDWDMGGAAKDARGQPVYGYDDIPADTYPKLQPSGTVYGTKPVKTITVEAVFVASTNWINDHEGSYDTILKAFAMAKPEIQKLVEPK
jgi:TRAP-type uncharacterized transport system substrate-binding protein